MPTELTKKVATRFVYNPQTKKIEHQSDSPT